MKKSILVSTSLILITLLITGCSGGKGNGMVDVAINVQNAPGVGSLQMELVYDASLLEVTGVKPEKLASNAMVESNTGSPGRVIIGIVDSAGINGQGPLVTVSFKVVGKGESCPITLENIAAYRATTLIDIGLKVTNGSVSVKKEVVSPIIRFSP
jgi:hypothetical protein